MPVAYWCGASNVAGLPTVAASKIAMSAAQPARKQPRLPDAVYFLDGGPSEPAADKAQRALPPDALPRLRETRDIVFVNQRGTGAGAPLECDMTGGESGVAPFTRVHACSMW